MAKITEYQIITADSAGELMLEVNRLLTEGWQPTGGACFQRYEWTNERKGYTESELIWSQTMVKYKVIT